MKNRYSEMEQTRLNDLSHAQRRVAELMARQEELSRPMWSLAFQRTTDWVDEMLETVFINGGRNCQRMRNELARGAGSICTRSSWRSEEKRWAVHNNLVISSLNNDEHNKEMYYDIMSFCRDGETPFCDPNCEVKVLHGTIIGITFEEVFNGVDGGHPFVFRYTFQAKLPSSVMNALAVKGIVQYDQPHVYVGEPAIVCHGET